MTMRGMDEAGRHGSSAELAWAMVAVSPVGMAAVDAEGTVLLANPAAELLVGPLLPGRPIGRTASLGPIADAVRTLAGGDLSQVHPLTLVVKAATGQSVWVTVARLRPGDEREEFLLSLVESPSPGNALQDPVTGLLNRRALLGQMEMLAQGGGGIVACLDMSDLGAVNKQHGQESGDQVIVHVARVLATLVPHPGISARIGGDEFVILLPGATLAEMQALLERIRATAHVPLPLQPVDAGSQTTATVSVCLSAGIAELTGGRFPDHALLRADRALDVAKARGGNTAVVDGPEVQNWARDRSSLMSWLHEMREERDRLRVESRTDALTGLPNPRALTEAEDLLADAEYPVAVLFFDIDAFGDYNKRYGDAAGDEALVRVASRLADELREGDQVFRKGGEEFVALLPGADRNTALAVAERLRAAVESLELPHAGNRPAGVITVTVAVATTSTRTSPAAARESAAETAYAAKTANQRNKVHQSVEPGHAG
jgi:diguanylate cyclase (GGDEF)-like protein